MSVLSAAYLDELEATMRTWGAEHVACAVVRNAEASVCGDVNEIYALASLTKPLFTYATLIAIEEGSLSLDEACGPEGSTLRHTLSHSSGYSLNDATVMFGAPGTRRIYSNAGYKAVGELFQRKTSFAPNTYFAEAVAQPLGLTKTTMQPSPETGMRSTIGDVSRLLVEFQTPTLISAATMTQATTVTYPGLDGVLPGFGRQRPNDWGLGFEIRASKAPHWTGSLNSPQTFGHFGRAGSFFWVDPAADVAVAVLTDRAFDTWAAAAWPPFSDQILRLLL